MDRKKLTRTLPRISLLFVIIFLALIWMVPIVGTVVTSFRTPGDISTSGWWTIFKNPFNAQYSLENYIVVITHSGIGKAFLNSLIISIPGTILPVLIGMLAAYALAWMRFPGRQTFFVILLGLLVVPIQITLIPVLRILVRWNLCGTFPGIWLAQTAYGLCFAIYLLHNTIASLPKELLDAAEIDGASSFYIFSRLVFPLCLPIIISLVAFQFVWVWNDLLVVLVYGGGAADITPLTVRMSTMVGSYGEQWHLLTAGVFISIIPPLAVFFSLQRYFVRGILAGAIKG